MVLAIDSETTGLFIHKGCGPFLVTAHCDQGRRYLWRFHVNPITREITAREDIVQSIRDEIAKHETLVFHNANFDLQVLNSIGITWGSLFDSHEVHDTMIMSHAYRSSDLHGLKENAVLYLKFNDDDEKLLTETTHQARTIAKRLNWCIADKNDLHPSLVGTNKTHYRCDYWIPRAVAIMLDYPKDHPWRHICDDYAERDAERTIGLSYVLGDLIRSIKSESKYNNSTQKQLLELYGIEPTPYTGTLYDKYEESRQLMRPILDMQAVGIPVKPRALIAARQLYTKRIATSLEEMRQLLNLPNFNPRTPSELQDVLFNRLGFKPTKWGKTAPSADKDVITKLLSEVDLESSVEPRYQFLVKLKSYRKEVATDQYLNGYDKHSSFSDKRVIQPSFLQTRTGTGRLSSEQPNSTNVGKKDMSNPFADDKDKVRAALFAEILGIDTDHRFSLRNVFGPRYGELWTCIDYDQIQLRIFAIVSESYDLIDAFLRGDDVHNVVAQKIFNKQDIDENERTAAKAVNFGLLFGAGPRKIELLAGVPGLCSLFMSNFPKAKIYLDSQSRLARQYGYVHTVGGYRLYVPRESPHAASCYVIQGTEAEIVKRAMCYISQYLRVYNSDPRRDIRDITNTKSPTRSELELRRAPRTGKLERTNEEERNSSYPSNNPNERQVPERVQSQCRKRSPIPGNTNSSTQSSQDARRIATRNLSQQSEQSSTDMEQAARSIIDISNGKNDYSLSSSTSGLLAQYQMLMMVHDELVFVSRNMGLESIPEVNPDKPKNKVRFSDINLVRDKQLSSIMNLMELAGTQLGIPCKVDAKVTSTDWATRNSLEFERLAV